MKLENPLYRYLNGPNQKLNYLILITFLLISNFCCLAKDPIILKDNNYVITVDSSHFSELEYTAEGYKALANSRKKFFYNENTEKSYWYSFTVINDDTIQKDWLLVSYNYSIDEIDLLIKSNNGIVEKQFFRDTMSIYSRELQHKQPVFKIRLSPHESKHIIVRIHNDSPFQYVFAFYSYDKFFTHFFSEYLLFGLFYGLMLFILLYSIMYFIFFNDKVILIYALFITSQTLFMLFRDGNGLFLMPDYTEYADSVKHICLAGLSVFVLLYTVYFLKIPTSSRLFKVFIGLIAFRIIYTTFNYQQSTLFAFHLELGVILFCTFHSIRIFLKGNPDAKYMSIGFSLLTLSYILYYLTLIGFTSSTYGFFGLYYGMAAEGIFMTMALTERFKRMRLENFRQEQMNKELEQLVTNRTELLKEQSEELNLFLYSASHDLKGPLKSIKGLCTIGLKDKEAKPEQIYNLILNRLKRLELNINDLNAVTNIKNTTISKTFIDFTSLHNDMLEAFHEMPGFEQMTFSLTVNSDVHLISDTFAMRCIYQNIFENAIKYRDTSKNSFLKITVSNVDDSIHISFQDNGQGISKDNLPLIFNMFYRGNENSKEDTGLGLYIVKLSVNKLGGNIRVESAPCIGTTVSVVLPKQTLEPKQPSEEDKPFDNTTILSDQSY